MEVFNEQELERSLQKFPAWKRIAFMVQVGMRMLPNYERFSTESGFGDISILNRAFDAACTWIEFDRSPEDLVGLRDACDRQAPDTELFNSVYTSAALDAANVAAIILDAIDLPEKAEPIEVASLGRDTIDLFVQDIMDLNPSDPDFEKSILSHHLMQRELRRQREDLEILSKSQDDRAAVGRKLRSQSDARSGSLDD